MNEFPVLQTKRLILRAFKMNDAPVVQFLAGDFAIADTTSTIPHPYPNGAAEDWISTHETDLLMDRGIDWAIARRQDSCLIGAITIRIKENEKAEIGYWIGKPYWGQGYCSEAAQEVLEYGFLVKGLNRIYAFHFSRNPASGRVMQKIGMNQEGILRHHEKRWGKYEDLVVYGILRTEFNQINSTN
ncbi:GNAT family N-acetyltransferase [candidate division KSB1 bacterium]|nr:GNAT family N-acetyltransferase [candidate division KSB1 bacterium]